MQDLIDNMKAGDSKAFETCFNRYRPFLFWTIYKMIRNRADAEDLTMITFEKAFERIQFYNPTYKFSSWLYKIATNTVLDHIRRSKTSPQKTDELMSVQISDLSNPERELIGKETYFRLMTSVNNLCPSLKRVMTLYIDGLKYKEISDTLKVPMGTIEAYIFRAKNQLKKAI